MKTVKTFFFTFPALDSTAVNKKLKYSNSYLISIEKNKMFDGWIYHDHYYSTPFYILLLDPILLLGPILLLDPIFQENIWFFLKIENRP